MPFIQNTDADRAEMLKAIGVGSIEELFRDIPANLRLKMSDAGVLKLPPGKGELEVTRHIQDLLSRTRNAGDYAYFRGGGIYNHFVSTVVDHIALFDGSFITAYTPYQPECSQGTLTFIFEFQSSITALTGLEVANASMYDGASALAEAMMMGKHVSEDRHRKENRNTFVLAGAVNPEYMQVCRTYADVAGLKVVHVAPGPDGRVDGDALAKALTRKVFAVAVQSPNYLGIIEDVEAVVAAARENEILVVQAIGEALSLALLQTPAESGVDVCVGEGQSLGNHQFLGGPAFGFFASKKDWLRKMPGRIVSETKDKDGRRAFSLALATREQHIRREKATSNICTNQSLCALRALIHLAAWGKQGFVELAEHTVAKTQYAMQKLAAVPGVKLAHPGVPVFNEFVIQAVPGLEKKLLKKKVVGGLPLDKYGKGRRGQYLVAVTEVTTKADIDRYAEALAEAMKGKPVAV
ncbi:MAG: aminomethyl-transferring glycine dehydrogenase subunit GcvPA [Planctomycetes bacterium]|jgi:glycine dehydrogenase subunit 1|nr:aminomethyl-transferring glycine dehydrogenase subunit GcvPA [Planctomycetota bacterium]MCL4730011.1 aminomethyl-transferring glycine dehydrogenase subunit GcvPA [Planctomycetota bacterium]